MQSRRDQVQAQSYVLGRVTSALVMGEPETLENPHRRMATGTLAGVLVAALVVAGSVVFGFLKPGGATAWRAPQTLVVEKETGSRFVLVGGQLRPVTNYTSAILLFGKRPAVLSVASASLASVPRGLPLGIEGAPDTLPAADALAGAGWSVCALWGQDGAGGRRAGVLVALHRDDAIGPLPAATGFTVAGPDRLVYLIWNGRRFALTAEWMPRVLGYEPAQPASAGWLNQLPAGPDIVPVAIPGRGEVGTTIGDGPARVGQVFAVRVPGTPERYFVLLRDGLRELSPTAFALVMGDPATASAYPGQAVRPLEISPYELARLAASPQTLLSEAVPAVPPGQAALDAGQTWCVESGPAGTAVAVRAVRAGPTAAADALLTRTQQTADAVAVDAGLGGLVREARPGQAPGNSYFLITDTGAKYPLAPAVADLLGYPPAGATLTPAAVLALLPTGPVLDPVAART